jgi:hypothetical protein
MIQLRYLAILSLLAATSFAKLLLAADDSAHASVGPSRNDVKLTASIDKDTAAVAEPFQLTFTIKAPRGTHIEWPALNQKLGDLEIRHVAHIDDVPSSNSTETRDWTLRLTLDSIKSGDVIVPPLDIRYALPSNAEFQSLQSQPQHIRISSVLEDRPDPTRFRDIKQTVDVAIPPAPSSWLPWAGETAGILVAGGLLVFALKRRRAGLAPSVWALKSISDLEANSFEAANISATFDKILEIVREYFELEFDVPVLPRTTQEVLADASEEIALPRQTAERLKWLSTLADEIKFARLSVGPKHLEQAFAQSKSIIAECVEHRRALAKEAA